MPDAVPAFVWVADLGEPEEQVILAEDASHHVARVCRARLDDVLTLTDGRGGIARGHVERLSPRVEVRIDTVERRKRDSRHVLLCGAPEGQRFDWLIEKLSELGVARVRPIECARRAWPRVAVRPDRWRRLALAALQQSRGCYLLQIEAPTGLEEALSAESDATWGMLADPDGAAAGGIEWPAIGTTVAVVGPAEGLTDAEKTSVLSRGFVSTSLAASRLRTETAALACACRWAATRTSQD